MSLLRNNEALLLADLLRKAAWYTQSSEAKAHIMSLASCWACMSVALIDTGKAVGLAKEFQCWPVSIEFCVKLAVNTDGLVWRVSDYIEKWLHNTPDAWCVAATLDQFESIWIGLRVGSNSDIKIAMTQLLNSRDAEVVAERLFGAQCMSTWPTYSEPGLGVHIERKIQSLAPEQLAHVSWESGLQLLRSAGVLDLRLAEMIGDTALAHLLEIDIGL